MKKKIILISGILIYSFAYSQVGIDTETPKATLDVMSKPSDITKADGIIAPRLTGTELKSKDALYTADQNATLIYVTQALNLADTTTKTKNVTSVGYYYYDAPNNIWQKMDAPEPWYEITTNSDATLNTQNIYQMGKVGIGVKPETNTDFSLYVKKDYTPGTSSYSGGIKNIFLSKGENNIGFDNTVTDNSTSTGSSNIQNYGIKNVVKDLSAGVKNGYGTYINYNYQGAKNNGNYSFIHGLESNLSVNAVGGELFNSYNYGVSARVTAAAVSGTGNFVETRALSGLLVTKAEAGQTNNTLQAWGAMATNRPQGAGTINIDRMYGVSGAIEPEMQNGGVLNVTNSQNSNLITDAYAAGLRSYTNFNTVNGGSGTYNFNRLMGMYIQTNQAAGTNVNISKSYGIYIERYRFTGDTPANAYNFYSAGEDTKNYFQGKVGIGTENPAAQLHVVKQSSDLTPAIIEGTKEFADNATAIAAGLSSGALYRTGDLLKVVH
ncbi:hypothetical protein AB4Y90_17265 [Chryseobacterium sp. 2TAF14]|uniref:hypothetical protein n=1 Tax=Chryseobacterium sp. 2TAF14 TaxID=3233007 RepID=UPI003F9040BE